MPTPRRYASPADRQRAYRDRQEQARRAALEARNLPATAAIPTMPSSPRWKALRDQAQAILAAMVAEMTDYHEERSEVWQESEKGNAFQEMIDATEAARDSVEEIPLF